MEQTKVVKASEANIKEELWRRGFLMWLLYPHQRAIYNKVREIIGSDDPKLNSYVIDCARQFGKSFIMFLIACEECLREKNRTVVYVGPLKSQVNEIINGNTFGVIFQSCPQELQPKYDGSTLAFPNGSRIRLAGTDNKNYSNLRGGAAHLVILDEAGFMSDLDVGVLPTVLPMTKTTNGKVIFASTPPDTLDHDYIQVLHDHEEEGLISTYTIWDDKSLTENQLQKIINQCRGRETTKFKREYECKRIVEASIQVVPELNEELAKKLIMDKEYINDPNMRFWHKYVVADTGVKDKTAVLFAHYNYHKRKLVVDAMLDLQGSEYSTAKLAGMIKDKVNQLWPEGYRDHIRYIADSNNKIVINDLNITYSLPFIGTSKGRLDEMVQKVRDWFADEKVYFAPDAIEALNCARFAIWAKSRDEFARSPKYGHYDALAALTYLIRNINEHKDPIPGDLGFDRNTMFMTAEKAKQIRDARNSLAEIFYNPNKGITFR